MEMRSVRSVDVDGSNLSVVANGIEDMYADKLDVIVVRNAFAGAALGKVGERLDSDERDPGWARPNVKMPVEDLQVLGTDTPATPTYQAPRGGSLDAYLASAAKHDALASPVFEPGYHATDEIRQMLSRFSGGRAVRVAQAADGRTWVPFTIRRLTDGKQIGIHHDYHYRLDLYQELTQQTDTRTLISYVVTLRKPDEGGELFVYGATSDAPDVPKLPNGFSYDLAAIEARYDSARFVMNVGDLFLLASGRCLHRVGKVAGPHARVTMGGFLALSKDRREVFFWS